MTIRKHTLLLCMVVLSAMVQAANRYVSTTGDDTNDGLSWSAPMTTIQAAIDASVGGDTVFIAAGTYYQTLTTQDGVCVFGSMDPESKTQNVETTPTILDGSNLSAALVIAQTTTLPVVVDGLVVQNANHSASGGGANVRANCTLNNCVIRSCTTSSSGGGVTNKGVVSNCLIELCNAGSSGGAVYNVGGTLYNCIIRGCGGEYGAIRNSGKGVVYNCVVYNNECTVEDWPNTGGIFNEANATCYNSTFANNYGSQYGGCHSEGNMYNCVLWGNQSEEGFTDPPCYIGGNAQTRGAGNNAADSCFESKYFTVRLSLDNTAARGPHFVAPTNFVGQPKNAGQIAAMRAADFSVSALSPVIDQARPQGAPKFDIEGNVRPIGSGVDQGAYEFDPNAPVIAVEGVAMNVDTLFVEAESSDAFTPVFTPKKATNRNVTWWIEDPAVATIDSHGVVTGIKPDTTRAAVKTEDGGFTDTAIVVITPKPIIIIHREVLLADSLYHIEDYTIPSYIPMWVAKEAARKDSTEANLQALRDQIKQLVSKENPYCLIANINGDPTTRMAFTWFTNGGITNGKVQLVAKADATEKDFTGESVITIDATPTTTIPLRYAVSSSGIIKATGMTPNTKYTYVSHKALATNLTPGTTYSYRVGYDSYWSDIAKFETANTGKGEFSFVYMTDSHIMDQDYVKAARISAESVVKNVPEAKFCVFPGDFVETGTIANSEWEWEQWFETSMRSALYNMPFVTTDGNHDDTENLNYDLHFNTDNHFNQTCLVKPQFQGITYSFVYGDVLFLVYSLQDYWRGDYDYDKGTSTYLTTDLGNWFRDQVAAHPECKYRVTLCHKNVFSGSGHQEDEETPLFRATMLPIFKECKIDLALQGHDHCYEVMGPVDPDSRTPIKSAIKDVKNVTVNASVNMTGKEGGTFTTDDGTLYFIGATCGAKRYYPLSKAEMEKQKNITKMDNYFDLFTSKFGQPGTPSFTVITVKEDGIYLDTYKTNNMGTLTPFNSIKVVRSDRARQIGDKEKFICNGQLLIKREGETYNVQGMRL